MSPPSISTEEFIYTLSHEIDNPSNSIFLDAETMEKVWKIVITILDEYIQNKREFFIGGCSYEELKKDVFEISDRMKRNSMRIKRITEKLRSLAKKDVVGPPLAHRKKP
jgi:hypothetical protein